MHEQPDDGRGADQVEGQAELVHQRVARTAATTPDAVAVVAGSRSLTFGELDRRADQVAEELRSWGVRTGSRVALCLERSPELAVGALAVIRAGAAYVPLDPAAPTARLRNAADDAGVIGWLTTAEVVARVPEGRWRVAILDRPASAAFPEPPLDELPPVELRRDDAAYVIFTSGSTGRPKGVEVTHGALANLVDWHLLTHAVSRTDRATLVANPAFDASVWELWPYLVAGATVHVPGEADLGSVQALVAWLARAGITISFLPTPLAELALGADWPAETRLRTLLTGGDRLRRRPAPGLPFELVNNYGPTECTVLATAGRVEPGDSSVTGAPSIGRPIANVRVYVLDPAGDPVAAGGAGELHLAGPQVALGYVGRPELTAGRFLPDPFGSPGARMYRTGDLARWLPSGDLEFLGRSDHQIKIRGHRIEPGEIEARLIEHPAVLQAAVTAREDLPGDPRLVAYLLCPDAPPSLSQLRGFLRERLPEPMLPSAFVVLEEFPLTPNGKLDRRALPAPEAGRLETVQFYRAPQTPTERVLVEIWEELLGRQPVGAEDDFFELGGHSLLATQVVSRVRERLARELPLRAIFESPRIAALARTLDAGNPALNGATPIVSKTGPAPLSFAQQRLWFLHRLFPHSAEYNVPVVVSLHGELDEQSLASALTTVVQRHEILRSRIVATDEAPALAVDPPGPVSLAFHDLTPTAVEARHDATERLLTAITGAPFDLAGEPPLRAALVRIGSHEHLLALTFHHIAFDGWSVGVLMRELGHCYRAHALGTRPDLAPLAIQYSDFAAWQRKGTQDAQDARLTEQVAFWRDRLSEVPVLNLPADGPLPERRSGPGRGIPFELPEELTRGVLRLSQEHGTTPFTTLLAAFQVLLSRYSGQRDMAVAVPVAGRTRTETESLIGCFVNTLVLRCDLSESRRFTDVMDKTREGLLEGLTHQEIPFERLVQELHPDRDLHRNPLAQVLFGARDPMSGFDAPGLRAERYEWGQGSAGFDLAVEVEVSPAGIRGRFDHPDGLFEDATVRQLARHYQLLLAGAVADPTKPVAELPLITEEERRGILAASAGQPRPLPDRPVHELVAEVAAVRPAATAIEWDGRQLSYGELVARAHRFADQLRALGAGPGVMVATCLPRGPELVAAILGILRAGAAYLPLDSGQPPDRLAFMLEQAGTAFALTNQELASGLAGLPVRVISLDELGAGDERQSGPRRGHSLDHLAYVLFTSGSTGRPKPVAVPHRALVNHALAIRDLLEIRPSDRVLQFASAGFDVFAEEVFPTLLAGARLVFPPASAQPIVDFGRTLEARGVTVLNLPSSFWALWARDLLASDRPPPATLRLVVIGSEEADGRLLGRWRAQAGIPVANVYGLSEATISTTARLEAEPTPTGTVPIGRPIPNTQTYVLDAAIQPLPGGALGELFVAGLGLAHGYLGRPGLTAERFLPDPFGPPGARMYRTGDLARWLPSGDLEFLGRSDHQIKIRGHRIEPGEIEARLIEHPAVLQAAVSAREDLPGDPRLVAYLLCPDAPPSLSQLRGFLRERLPEPMLPSAFVVLEEFPLTPNGKLDRRALPAPEAGRLETDQFYRAPQTPTERVLVEIWEELLGRQRVGAEDDFFELGGHSLLATQVVSRVRERLARELPLRAIFENPRIAALARALSATTSASEDALAPALRPIERDTYRIAFAELDRPHEFHQSRGTQHVN